jgi:predicted TIM-barrel fold metal-dependent hydrolase
MMSGILERHPKLDVFFAESGASWIPYTLNQCDYYWPRYSRFDGNELRMLPSDYWRRQCYAGFWTDIISPQVVDWLGEDNVLWEGDYLHTIATFPNSRNIQAESLKDIVDSNIRAKILAGNSVKLFKLD